jgi:hypothetical protein
VNHPAIATRLVPDDLFFLFQHQGPCARVALEEGPGSQETDDSSTDNRKIEHSLYFYKTYSGDTFTATVRTRV